jgi:type IV pilus biogenesis protein CpaD/CtpE
LLCALLVIPGGCATGHRGHVPEERAAMSVCPDDNRTAGNTTGVNMAVRPLPLGCDNRANLRAMLANPEDLDHGQALKPASGEREALAIEAYRKGEVKKLGSVDESTSKQATPVMPASQ